jgi:hypothetical protein
LHGNASESGMPVIAFHHVVNVKISHFISFLVLIFRLTAAVAAPVLVAKIIFFDL